MCNQYTILKDDFEEQENQYDLDKFLWNLKKILFICT